MWLKRFSDCFKLRPKNLVVIIITLFFATLLALHGYRHYQKQQPKDRITAEILLPNIVPLPDYTQEDRDNNFQLPINPLTITFGAPVAPLQFIGKNITTGINLSPTTVGIWRWEDEKTLTFTPQQDWAAGEKFNLNCDKNVFTAAAKLATRSFTFTTQPLTIECKEFKFYQDPTDPKMRAAIATLEANYPLNTSSLEKNINLVQKSKEGEKALSFTITYDRYKRTAYIRSEPLTVTANAYYVHLKINKNIAPLNGNSTTTTLEKSLLIPDASTFFKVSSTNATIVRNMQDRPEQVLNVETSAGVTAAELNRAIHAYLLPAPTEKQPWSAVGEVTPKVLELATPITLEPIPSEHDFAMLHSYKVKLAPTNNDNGKQNNYDSYGKGSEGNFYLYLSIDKGMKSYDGFALTALYKNIVTIPPSPKEISFLHPGAILAKDGEKKISVLTRGVPAVKAKISRLLPNTINLLITQTSENFSNPEFINKFTFNDSNISAVFSTLEQINNSDPSKNQYLALDLEKYLATNKTSSSSNAPANFRGLFLLQLQGWDEEKNEALNVSNQRLILVTDLGLIVKNNGDRTHDLFITSITKGGAIAGAKVTLLGKNGVPLLQRISDNNGRVSFPNLEEFTEEREPTVYLAQSGDDLSFIPYKSADRALNYTRYDVGGVIGVGATENHNLRAFLFTERSIYRPGDTMHIAGIIKQNYLVAAPKNLPLELVVRDPNYKTIKKEVIFPDKFGYFASDFSTQPATATGQYSIVLFLTGDNNNDEMLTENNVSVQEFLPDNMHLNTQFTAANNQISSADGWISPTLLQAKVMLQNLYGTPAQQRRISSKITLEPTGIHFDQYKNYTFTNPLAETKKDQAAKVHNETLPEATTDNNGQATLKLNETLGRFDKTIYNLTLFVEAFEKDGGRSVTTKLSTLVNPLPYLIGYKARGDLSFIKQNEKRDVQLIAINSSLKASELAQLTLQVLEKHNIATLTKKPDGTYQYQTVEQLSPIANSPFIIANNGSNYQLNTTKIGDFRIIIKDSNNNDLCKIDYSVVGTGQKTLQQNAELNVKLNKTEYLPGDDVEVEITAPYAGSGLITIERDRVYATQWFHADTTNSLQKIHIPESFKGNGYINVTLVRDWNSSEIFINPLSYSVVPIKILMPSNTLHVNLQAPTTALAGSALPITYSSDKPGKIIIFAVDEGILQVTKYATPDPLGYFFAKEALGVETTQILDQILPKYIMQRELSAVGGDGSEMEIDKHLNPFRRKTDAPVIYWSKILAVSAQPQQVLYQVPNYFNGSLRIMAVAVADEAVGSAVTSTKVTNHFVIETNAPTFVAPHDEFEISTTIGCPPTTQLPQTGENRVKAILSVSPGLEIVSAQEEDLLIERGGEKSVHFKLRAKDILGNATISITASAVNSAKSSTATTTLSIRPATPYTTTVNSGFTTKDKLTLDVKRVLYPEQRNVVASLSSSPLILLGGMQNYLENFPYYCTEQIVSKMFVELAMLKDATLSYDEREKLTGKLQDLLQLLLQRQSGDGGFNYWPENSGNNPESIATHFASLYTIHFLTEAKAAGIAIPHDALERGIVYLKEFNEQANEKTTNLEQQRLHAYSIYLLARNEIVTTNYLEHLQFILEKDDPKKQLWRRDITATYLAATYKLLQDEKESGKLVDYFTPDSEAKTQFMPELSAAYDSFMNPNTCHAQYLALIAQHFPEKLPQYNKNLTTAIAAQLNSKEISTVLAGYSSLALAAATNATQNATPTATLPMLNITEILSDSAPANTEKDKSQNNSLYQKIVLNAATKKIVFNSENNYQAGFFYQLVEAGFDKNIVTEKNAGNGMEIWREYRDLNGKELSSAQVGQEIEVHIRVRAKNPPKDIPEYYIYNQGLSLAIVDLLPGGFDIVRESVKENPGYVDLREDRAIFFVDLYEKESQEIIYHIKATSAGRYTIPPAFVEAMYDNSKRALGASGIFTVY